MSEPDRKLTVAVVDDNADQRALLREALEESGYAVCEGGDGAEAIELSRSRLLDAMVLDVRMPGMSGLEALAAIKAERSEIVIILLTAYMDLRDAVSAIKTGALDYLEKPIDLDELVVAVDEALGVEREALLSSRRGAPDLPDGIVAESPAMRAVFSQALRVAPTEATALILGPSGSGKEVLARFIHEHSPGRDKPFVAVNCAALPENLIESELFGHERGSFTGASSQRRGCFEEASGGVLLLDEIGEMPLALQPKLLRVLENKTIRRVGGSRDIPIDARVIAATNRSLEDDARDGRFREDLLYRLNVFPLQIPPLCERREDILPLAALFLSQQGLGDKRFSPASQRLLLGHGWPGNVRELRNAVVRSAIVSHGSVILPEDLPEPIQASTSITGASPSGGVLVGDMEEIQKRAILEALERTGGNRVQASKLLGISRRNLIYKLRSYGM